MSRPITTRLRYVTAKKPDLIVKWLAGLGMRVQIYGAPVWDGKRWVMWFVPIDDMGVDVPSGDLG